MGFQSILAEGIYHGFQAWGCVYECYANPAWIVANDFADDCNCPVMVGAYKPQSNLFVNSEMSRGFNEGSAKTYVSDVPLEQGIPSKAVHW